MRNKWQTTYLLFSSQQLNFYLLNVCCLLTQLTLNVDYFLIHGSGSLIKLMSRCGLLMPCCSFIADSVNLFWFTLDVWYYSGTLLGLLGDRFLFLRTPLKKFVCCLFPINVPVIVGCSFFMVSLFVLVTVALFFRHLIISCFVLLGWLEV